MFQMIAQIEAEPAMLMSVAKPLLMLVVLGAWAWLVGRLDKDAGFYYANQERWGMAHLGIGMTGFIVMLFVPIFWVGWLLGVLVLAGGSIGYAAYRNGKVPEEEKWKPKDLLGGMSTRRERESARANARAKVRMIDQSGNLMEVPHGDDANAQAFDLFQDMLVFAVPRGADRIDVTVDSDKAKFVVRIDGVRVAQPAPDRERCAQLIDYLKENAGMDLAERRRKQTGKLGIEVEGYDRHEIKLTTLGSTRALQLIIEFDLEDTHKIPIDELGLLPRQKQAIEDLLNDELSKVVIFASPAGCGTTTSMYALMNRHDPYTSSVMTFEKQSPYQMEGVNHNFFEEGANGEKLAEQFASLLRSDPNVMMVEQLTTPEMGKLIAQYADDTRFYISLPAKDTFAALKLWIKIVGDQRLAADSLAMIVSQRLTRRLCVTCRSPYHPDDAAMKKLNIKKGDAANLYKASGKVVVKDDQSTCQDCHGMGYRGRIGVFEVMPVDKQARALIASGEGERLKAHLRKQHMVYLQEAALTKVVEGVTDIKEATRTMDEHQKG